MIGRKVGFLILLIICSGVLTATFFYDPVLAVVGNHVLRLNEWRTIESKMYGNVAGDPINLRNRLETWGNEEIVLDKAKEWQINVNEDKIKEFSRKISDNDLQAQHLTRQESESLMRRNEIGLLMKTRLTSQVSVSEQELKTYFAEHQDEFRVPETRVVQRIRVPGEKTGKVNEISQNLTATNFGSLMNTLSEDDSGGSIGPEGMKEFADAMGGEIAEQIFQHSKYDIFGPIRRENVVYWIKVQDINPAHQAEFADIHTKLKQEILLDKQKTTIRNWLTEQKTKTRYEIRDVNFFRYKLATLLFDLIH